MRNLTGGTRFSMPINFVPSVLKRKVLLAEPPFGVSGPATLQIGFPLATSTKATSPPANPNTSLSPVGSASIYVISFLWGSEIVCMRRPVATSMI
jgi:hypothetical protein